ncbi:hypothetical protein DPM19_07570 [Actinomadura craniellae]|uniref:DUF6801 domain-containing protein n=2 Tax=Actinomadura craniellae TaxID=2231787 RepID=A0A365HCK4_9ACTN|nr:hypothetical protein DPM19_07570 [Actinomadura craniellae]
MPERRTGRRRALAALAAAVFSFALLQPPPAQALPLDNVPEVGVDTGRFKLPINCKIILGGVLPIFNLGSDVDVQGVAPVQLGPGQEFWLTQGSGNITIPSWLTFLAPLLGITKADARVTDLSIGASNSTPASINIAKEPVEIKDIAFEPGQPLKVGLPLKAGETFDVGPYTAPGSGSVTFKFDHAVAEITLKSDWGFTLPITADCTASQGNALLTVAVGGPAGQPPAKIHGAPLNFPEPASNEVVGIINAPYTCTLGGQPVDVGIAVGGHFPLSIKKGTNFSFTNASGALTIPAKTVNKLLDMGYTTAAGKVTKLELLTEGGTPASMNVAANGIDIPTTPLERDKKIVLSLPTNGTLTAGPFGAAPGSTRIAVALGSAAASFTFNGSTSASATCGTPAPLVYLVDTPVI